MQHQMKFGKNTYLRA